MESGSFLVGQGSSIVTAVAQVRSLSQELGHASGTAKKKKNVSSRNQGLGRVIMLGEDTQTPRGKTEAETGVPGSPLKLPGCPSRQRPEDTEMLPSFLAEPRRERGSATPAFLLWPQNSDGGHLCCFQTPQFVAALGDSYSWYSEISI